MEASDYLVKASDYLDEDSDYIVDYLSTTQIAKTDLSKNKKDIFLTKIAKYATKKNIENSFYKVSVNSYIVIAIFIFLLGVLILWRVIFFKKSKYFFTFFFEIYFVNFNETSPNFNLRLKTKGFDFLETP